MASSALGAGLAMAAIAAAALAQDATPVAPAVHVEPLDRDVAAMLADADEAAARGDWGRAAERYRALFDCAGERAKDQLVPPPSTEPAGEPPAPGDSGAPVLVGFSEALRARLLGLPPEGLAAYRAAVDARAAPLFERGIARRDPDLLEGALRRFLFATGGERAATFLGDLYLEQGELLGALATYELAARWLGPAARGRVESRLAEAARALAAARAGPRVPPAVPDLVVERPIRIGLRRPDEPDLGPGSCVEPVPLEGGGAAIARRVRVSIVRPLKAEAAPHAISLPPGAGGQGHGAPGLRRLAPGVDGGLLCAAIAHSRLLDGDAWRLPGEAPGPGSPGGAALAQPGEGIADAAWDLYLYDLDRGARLLWTTGEVARFGGDAAWLAGVEWPGPPLVAAGAVFAAATTRGAEPEVYVAAFGARAPGRLRWRRFLCARSFAPEELREDGPPIQPALALGGGVLVVDTGLGVVAGLDAFRGDIRWLVRLGRAREILPGEKPRQPPRAPVARPAADPLVAGGLAIFSPRDECGPIALDLFTGGWRWRASTLEPLEAIGLVGGALFAAGAEEAALFDAASGKRLGEGLLLPSGLAGRGALFSAGGERGRGGALALLPLQGAVLGVAVRPGENGVRLEPVSVFEIARLGRCDVAAAPEGALFGEPGGLVILPPGGPGSPGEDARLAELAALLELYGAEVDAATLKAAMEELRASIAPPVPLPRATGDPGAFSIEPGDPSGRVAARAVFSGPGERRIGIAIERAGGIVLEVAPRDE